MPKSAAERQREYRERKRAVANKTKSPGKLGVGPRGGKSTAQRMRECRARKKMLRTTCVNLNQSNADQSQRFAAPAIVRLDVLDANRPLSSQSDTMGAANDPSTSSAREPSSDSVPPNYSACREVRKKLKNRTFRHVCSVCERLWFKDDLKTSTAEHDEILRTILPNMENIAICSFLAYEEMEAE